MNYKILFALLAMNISAVSGAQTLEKMNWFNEPAGWKVSDGKLTMSVTPKVITGVFRIMDLRLMMRHSIMPNMGVSLKPRLRYPATIKCVLIRPD